MINSQQLLSELQSKSSSRDTVVKRLEDDLRGRCDGDAEVDRPLRERYEEAKSKGRTALTYKAWREEELTQVAVAWVLGCVFVRFLEDNELVEVPKLAGPGDRLRRARDEHELYFRSQPEDNTERGYLTSIFEEVCELPAMKEFFDRKHNPLWLVAPSGDACRELWQFWQKTDPETGNLVHDFTDPDWSTRFLGDLYQDLSEAARKRFALLQTPDFVEEFILDRTLTPAIETFGYREVRMIDPTCGSGHFLLGGFARLFRIWQDECPGENPRVLSQRALDGVYGVDLNPFAVAIARFRLLLAALKVSGVTKLKNAPDFKIHLAVGDSLIHGARFDSEGKPYVTERQDMFGGDEDVFKDEIAHFFDTEDSLELHRILGQQYHAVVGNPPYITVKDKALNQLYRNRYDACHRQYSLSVPFMERFFDLAVSGNSDGSRSAGFTGQITANSFMKREFGKKLIESVLPRLYLTHVVDTSGAYIPGHGTPTVVLIGRNTKPSSPKIRTVMGIKGEPSTPKDPGEGKVWRAIVDQIECPDSESDYVSVADVEVGKFHRHPWSISGGGAAELQEAISRGCQSLQDLIETICLLVLTRADELYLVPALVPERMGIVPDQSREFVTGDLVRDWTLGSGTIVIAPYENNNQPLASLSGRILHAMWPHRTHLWLRREPNGNHLEIGKTWWEWSRYQTHRLVPQLSITFAFVATHNHFVLDRGGKVFKQSAPVIKLPADATEEDHLRLLGLLNSSTACFWMKQVFYPKGGDHVGQEGARVRKTLWDERYEFDGTKLKKFPLPSESPLRIATALDRLACELFEVSPESSVSRESRGGDELSVAEDRSARLMSRMVAFQEELDWQCYRHYGLIDASDNLEWPEARFDDLPPLTLGERAFEIRMARQMEAGDLETTWFNRHKDAGSKPITEFPTHWPDDYRALVERRLAFIESNKNINLVERPEYKRRWNTEPWAERQKEALRKWLLARLEGYFFDGGRVCDLKGSYDPASHGFTASTQPHLTSVNQLADVVSADKAFLEAAEVYEGSSGFSVPKLVRSLVESESVPYLPVLRYKESGVRKRREWEATWELQRKDDVVEAEVRGEEGLPQGRGDAEELQLKAKVREAQLAQVGEIPVPPKYKSGDFLKTSFWKLRGKLDVPKERWISYPGAERSGDDSLVIAWAGWDHLQQAQALAAYFLDAKDNQGWQSDRLKPLLAGLADLIPWLKQWHNDHNPDYGMGLGDYFEGFLEEQCRGLELTVAEVDAARLNAD